MLFRKLLRKGPFLKLHLQDELLEQFAKSTRSSQTEIALAADPIRINRLPTSRSARAELGIPEDGRHLVSCTGMVNRRKGVHHAINAFQHLAENVPSLNSTLLLIGPHDPEILSMLAAPRLKPLVDSGHILSIDRFLSSDEMYLVAEASELVLAPYPNHSGRSSIILWAAAAGTRVVAVDRGCIKHVVESQRLGTTCEVSNAESFSSAIQRSLAGSWTFEDEERARNYASWHSIENYQAMSSALVRRQLQEARVI
jgi:glycosyltransferase involved in cell wall biosynthesis